jgi:peptidylprolyl isomerase
MLRKLRLVALGSLSVMLSHMAVCSGDSPQLAPDKIKPVDKPQSMQQDKQQDVQQDKQDTGISKEEIAKISEALGNFVGKQLNSPALELNVESVIKGIRDGAAGKPAPIDEKEYHEGMLKIQQRSFNIQSEKNLKAANEFLEKNAKAPNIIVVEPGKLQYTVLQPGNGAVVDSTSNPTINYTGKYIDGTVFGSSEESGGPINIPLDQTIQGFSKGITGMKEGEKRRLFIHPDLGYGTGGHLPPNSLLIFDIEVVKADSPKTSMADEEDEDLHLALDDEDSDDEDDDKDGVGTHHPHTHKH